MFDILKNNKQRLINIFNVIVLFCIGIYLFNMFQYGVVSYDDLVDYLLNRITHGRYISQGFSILIIYKIPQLLNIHIQNFAVVSIAFFKTICLCFLIHVFSMSFYQHKKPNLFLGVLYIFSLIFVICAIESLSGHLILAAHSWLLGYLFPVALFLIIVYKCGKKYIYDIYSKEDKIILCIVSFIIASFNEMAGFCSIVLLFILSIKDKAMRLPLILNIIMNGFVLLSGISDVFSEYQENRFVLFSIKNIYDYLYAIYKVLFVDNFVIWIIFIILMTFLVWKRKDEKVKKIIKFTLLGHFSFLLLLLGLYYMGDTNSNYGYDFVNVRPFWITYFGINISYKILIMSMNIYILGFILSYIKEKKYMLSMYAIVTILLLLVILPEKQHYHFDSNEILYKKSLYMMDKFANFYLQQGKTAVLPREYVLYIYPDCTMPNDLLEENFSKEIYYFDEEYPGKNMYLLYLKRIYGLDITPGMTFRDTDEAVQIYKDNGGILTDEELKKLDFDKVYGVDKQINE